MQFWKNFDICISDSELKFCADWASATEDIQLLRTTHRDVHDGGCAKPAPYLARAATTVQLAASFIAAPKHYRRCGVDAVISLRERH